MTNTDAEMIAIGVVGILAAVAIVNEEGGRGRHKEF